ncbi:MAG TPA: hypothetical protein VMV46_21585 [Thermoanaerobaculia bacterium]|nr:hypothetical protein [Thermoanaerobaculia bacterium]
MPHAFSDEVERAFAKLDAELYRAQDRKETEQLAQKRAERQLADDARRDRRDPAALREARRLARLDERAAALQRRLAASEPPRDPAPRSAA